jgi:Protein of unknown function (DUF1641)
MVDQANVDQFTRLEQRLDALTTKLEQAVAQANQAAAQVTPAVATMVDAFDSVVARLQNDGIDPEQRLRRALHAADQMTRPATMTALDAMFTSGLLDANVLQIVGRLGATLAAVGGQTPSPVGMLGLLRGLRDPDVQRALGLLLAFGKQFGAELNTRTGALGSGATSEAALQLDTAVGGRP